jgi:hypothetical protein
MDGRAVWREIEKEAITPSSSNQKWKKRRFTMFKKKIVMLIAAAMMTLSASSAFAAFGDLELIRVYYERTTGTVEVATDLGTISTLLAAPSTTIVGAFGTVNTPSNMYAAYFAVDRATNTFWVSGSSNDTTPPVAVGSPGYTSLKSGSSSVYSTYNAAGGSANTTVTSLQSSSGYKSKLSATQGFLGNGVNNATRPNTEISLASLLDHTASSVFQNLYSVAGTTASAKGVKVAQISTNADGSTTITTANTPIPPAFFLMGSGLLGMFGLRRKVKAA